MRALAVRLPSDYIASLGWHLWRCLAPTQNLKLSTRQEMLSLLPRVYAASVSFFAAFSGSCMSHYNQPHWQNFPVVVCWHSRIVSCSQLSHLLLT